MQGHMRVPGLGRSTYVRRLRQNLLSIEVSWERQARRGNSFRLASLVSVQWLQAGGVVSSCRCPPWVLQCSLGMRVK